MSALVWICRPSRPFHSKIFILTALIGLLATASYGQPMPSLISVPSVETLARRATVSHSFSGPAPRWDGQSRGIHLDDRLAPALHSGEEESPNRFRGALLGSTFGVGLSAGLLLIASDSDWGDRYENNYSDDEEHLRASGLALLIVLGSAPVGAAIGAGLADEGLLGEALLTGVLGELVVGGTTALAGAGIASWARANNRKQNVVAGVGLSVGAAVGAALGATLVGRQHEEVLSYRDGAWRVGVPFPSVRLVSHDRSAAVHVPMVRARF